MKRLTSIILLSALLLSSCASVSAGQISADQPLSGNKSSEFILAKSKEEQPKKKADDTKKKASDNVYVMTIMSDYSQIYKRLKDFEKREYYYYDVPVEEEAVAEAPVFDAVAESPMVSVDSVMSAPALKAETTADYSKTNTQLDDVDEGDIVKTDGEYIYLIKDGKYLNIISAAGEDSALLSTTELKLDDDKYSSASEMYVYGDRVAVISGHSHENYSLRWDPSRYYTKVTVYDVSDPENPIFVSQTGQDGTYNTSRLVNDDLYLITRHDVVDYYNYDTEDYDIYVPAVYVNGEEELIDPNCIVCPQEIRSTCYTVVTRYSAETGDIELNKTILGAGNTVYMNTEHLYLADTFWFEDKSEPYQESVYTVVDYKSGTRTEFFCFDLENNIKTKAVGRVDGELLNQFAMDEYNGTFRVVTTENNSSHSVYTDPKYGFTNYKWHDSGRTNGLYVFDENLNLIGKIDGLAKNEKVYSVRFSGDTAYFVTFRTVDPLFTVDLSDPANPVILSELKIPGFSNYLHPYSEGLLFGLGQDADERTGWTRGMKLSMFDVSDPHAVSEKHCLKLDSYSSEALYNHKAILVSAEKNLIGFPTETGYVIYGYDTDTGFYKKAETSLEKLWASHDIRGLYSGDYVYIVTQDFTAVMRMADLELLTTVGY